MYQSTPTPPAPNTQIYRHPSPNLNPKMQCVFQTWFGCLTVSDVGNADGKLLAVIDTVWHSHACSPGFHRMAFFSLVPLQVFDSMQAAGIKPSVVTFSSLIHALGTAGQWQAAIEAFASMEKANVAPNEYTYSSLMAALRRGGERQRAQQLFEEMKDKGLQPTAHLYTVLMSAWQMTGDWQKVSEVLCRAQVWLGWWAVCLDVRTLSVPAFQALGGPELVILRVARGEHTGKA